MLKRKWLVFEQSLLLIDEFKYDGPHNYKKSTNNGMIEIFLMRLKTMKKLVNLKTQSKPYFLKRKYLKNSETSRIENDFNNECLL